MEKLQQRFDFGRWKSIYGARGDFNGRQLTQFLNFEVEIDQEKFIKERLRPISLSRARGGQREARVTEQEHRQFRGLVGSILWVARETRPDALGDAV
eukprot:3053748-Lingulodinium_polyedra.AAC.1